MVSLYLLQDREVLIISSSRKHWTDRHSHLFKSISFSVHCTRLYLAVRSERNMLSFLGKSSWASPKRSFTVTLIISGSTSAKEPGTASTSNEYFSRKQTLINRARCLGLRARGGWYFPTWGLDITRGHFAAARGGPGRLNARAPGLPPRTSGGREHRP